MAEKCLAREVLKMFDHPKIFSVGEYLHLTFLLLFFLPRFYQHAGVTKLVPVVDNKVI